MLHTPGPWRTAGPIGHGIYVVSNTRPIAVVYGPNNESQPQADAQLIATAPQLLEAAKLALMEFKRISYQIKADPDVIGCIQRIIDRAEGPK